MGSKLEQLLSYLRRDDVIQLRFRSDEPVMLHTTRRAHAVTVSPLTGPQIRRFFEDTAVAGRLDAPGEFRARDTVSLCGAPHDVEISHSGGALTVSVRLEDPPEDAATQRPQAQTREDVRAARSTDQVPATAVAQPTVHPTPTFTPVTPIPQGGVRGRPRKSAAHARITATLISARGRRARQVRIAPGKAVRLRVGEAWVEGGPALCDKDIEESLRALLELRHHERLAARGDVARAVHMGGAGRWCLRVVRQSGSLALCFDSVLEAPPPVDPALSSGPLVRWLVEGHGLCLLAGPPGSGKTTALASLASASAASAAHRLGMAWVSSREMFDIAALGPAATWFEAWPPSRSWSPTIADALDHTPDILVVDGLRDAEAAAEVLRAASARQRVCVTLDAASVVDGVRRLARLGDAGGIHDAADLVASVLRFAAEPRPPSSPREPETPLSLRVVEVSTALREAIRSGDRIALELAERDGSASSSLDGNQQRGARG